MRAYRDYAVITASYWVFTITDGALRMLVLFHLHELGYAPIEVVSLFLFYEFFGIVTNFTGGWIAARFGLVSTLFAGLALQIAACSALGWQAGSLTLGLVLVAQAVSGVAKDLTKMSAKSYIKLLVPKEDARGLLRWVALLTGSKNALKGAGFFVGAALLQVAGFRAANFGMAGALGIALVASLLLLPRHAGRSAVRPRLRQLWPRDPRVQWLAAARLFLFGARDAWFVFALPIYLAVDLGWSHARAGAFLALWVIGYGIVQASAPRFVGPRSAEAGAGRALLWTALLTLPLLATGGLLRLGGDPGMTLVVGLAAFGVVFAACSALHSWLIVHYAEADTVALNVGFYYSANATGRLLGTLVSGAVFQAAGQHTTGLLACLAVALGCTILSGLLCVPLRRAERRHASAVRARTG